MRIFTKFISEKITKSNMVSWVKYLSAFVVVCVLSGFMAALAVYFKPHKDTRDAKADFVFTTDGFAADVTGKDTSYTNKYIGKIVELSGKLGSITRDSVQSTLVFSTTNYDISGTLDETSMKSAGSIKAGDAVQLKCICTGIEPAEDPFPGVIQMNRCAIIEK
ncbi:MAG: OB-fold protein [Flavobacteriales bacterium]